MSTGFLSHILGNNGYDATQKAINKYPSLKPVILPRAILSWVSVMGDLGYDSELPGEQELYLSLKKNEDNLFDGALVFKNELYAFEGADIIHVAASIGVALGVPPAPLDKALKAKDLTKLGKSIDLIVKSQVLKKLKKQNDDEVVTQTAQNPHDKPLKQAKQIPAIRQVSSQGKKPVNKPNMAIGQGQSKLVVKKSEANKACKDCGINLFNNNRFTGCICVNELAGFFKSEITDNEIILSYNKNDLDEDAISTIILLIKD